jgi:type 1 glutamine amidotransferase
MKDQSTVDPDFAPDFSKYQVVVLNLDDVQWSDKTKASFVDYISKGGGLVLLHESNIAFPEWKEYNTMIGLGGWGSRNEKDGVYYYWKEGKYVRDSIIGAAGMHGERVPFVINVRDSKHPIMKGLPIKWLHQNDELYGNLRGPAQNITVLATGFSEKESGGTGKEEPLLLTISYSKGRVFHTTLGHVKPEFQDGLQDVGFQVTFSRGVEWAATGKVKQKIPKDFPTEKSVLLYDLEKLNTN